MSESIEEEYSSQNGGSYFEDFEENSLSKGSPKGGSTNISQVIFDSESGIVSDPVVEEDEADVYYDFLKSNNVKVDSVAEENAAQQNHDEAILQPVIALPVEEMSRGIVADLLKTSVLQTISQRSMPPRDESESKVPQQPDAETGTFIKSDSQILSEAASQAVRKPSSSSHRLRMQVSDSRDSQQLLTSSQSLESVKPRLSTRSFSPFDAKIPFAHIPHPNQDLQSKEVSWLTSDLRRYSFLSEHSNAFKMPPRRQSQARVNTTVPVELRAKATSCFHSNEPLKLSRLPSSQPLQSQEPSAEQIYKFKLWPFRPTFATDSLDKEQKPLKYSEQGLILVRLFDDLKIKAREAMDITRRLDGLLQKKFYKAHELIVKNRKADFELEIKREREQMKVVHSGKDASSPSRVIVTSKNEIYVSNVHTDDHLSNVNVNLNKLTERQQAELVLLEKSIRTPLQQLDFSREVTLSAIRFAVARVERALEHYLRADSALLESPHCIPTIERANLSSEHTYSTLRLAMKLIADTCRELPKYYSSIDSSNFEAEISPMVLPDHVELDTDKGLKKKKKKSIRLKSRPLSAPPTSSSAPQLVSMDESAKDSPSFGRPSSNRPASARPTTRGANSGRTFISQQNMDDFEEGDVEIEADATDLAADSLDRDYADDFVAPSDSALLAAATASDDEQEMVEEGEEDQENRGVIKDGETKKKRRKKKKLKKKISKATSKANSVQINSKRGFSVDDPPDVLDFFGDGTKRMMQIFYSSGRLKKDEDEVGIHLPYYPIPCALCAKKFRGRGKTIPSIQAMDKQVVASHRKQRLQELRQELRNDDLTNKERLSLEKKIKVFSEMNRYDEVVNVFCSWECAKGWCIRNSPVQFKYHSQMMIDLSAGYVVAPNKKLPN